MKSTKKSSLRRIALNRLSSILYSLTSPTKEEEFTKENGSLVCAELLGLRERKPQVATPDERTPAYYAKRPCAKMVETAARIWANRKNL